jgi:hypothetical protein
MRGGWSRIGLVAEDEAAEVISVHRHIERGDQDWVRAQTS